MHSGLNLHAKRLYAIAREGKAAHISSAEFIKRHSLPSSSSVQSTTKKLLGKDFITKLDNVYSVTDRLFAMWIKKLLSDNTDSFGNREIEKNSTAISRVMSQQKLRPVIYLRFMSP